MQMIRFSDILYGTIELPEWIAPFLRIPEFLRLRGVRLSNVDSIEFKDFATTTRWEHCVAVAYLATRCAAKRQLNERQTVHLVLAALLHDVATPPFAHSLEYVLQGFDHELESQRLLKAVTEGDANPDFPVFASQLPQFQRVCAAVSRQLTLKIDPDEVAQMVTGEGELGFLLNGTVDLDNADNVTRANLHLGFQVDKEVPVKVAEWLGVQSSAPLNLASIPNESVASWNEYRKRMYKSFFEASPAELGRQAFLLHLCRRAVLAGVPRKQLIWNTDEGFLTLLENFEEPLETVHRRSLRELVLRFRLLEPTTQVAEAQIEDEDTLRGIQSPDAATWIEEQLSSNGEEVFVYVNKRRHYDGKDRDTLFAPALGKLLVYKLGSSAKNDLPPLGRSNEKTKCVSTTNFLSSSEAIQTQIRECVQKRAWLAPTVKRKKNVIASLNAVGDWGFRLSRNDSLHSYPSTFVHAIPACLINCLGLQGELVVDPFGGTGQTAVEVVKGGGTAVSGDINSVALLAAAAKLTFLPVASRDYIRSLSICDIKKSGRNKRPDFEIFEKWHHPKTFDELCNLRSFIYSHKDPALKQFLKATFSAILTSATARKGKQHGWFADNTPLPRGQNEPPYINIYPEFVERAKKSIGILEKLYSTIERSGRNPEEEMQRARIAKASVSTATPDDYGVEEGSVAGIVTSPPYLCMSDYTLGQRLSYYWLFPKDLLKEHSLEIGPRRQRFSPERALEKYFSDFEKFCSLSERMLRPGGYVAMVLGAPVAKAFSDSNVFARVDSIFAEHGFPLAWSKFREINWHRNHGYARLNEERISVYTLGESRV